MEPKEFEEGYIAFADGKSIDENPHSTIANGSWFAWAHGWTEALYHNLERKRESPGEDKEGGLGVSA